MNRRDFIKGTIPAAVATWTVTCKYEEQDHNQTDPKGHEGETGEVGRSWDYRVYCYERGQGEWCFSENTRGSFDYRREYFDDEDHAMMPYAGWMDQGKLHFLTLDDARDFIEDHVRAKDDTNLIDSIYDIYYVSRKTEQVEVADTVEEVVNETEIKVAHYWFNGDTGRQIQWETKPPYSDFNKIDFA